MNRFKAVLQDAHVKLRPWREEDAEWYVHSRDEEVFRWTTEKRGLSVSEAKEAIKLANKSKDTWCFAILACETNELLGNIALVVEEANRKTGEVMYWLAQSGRGRGLGTSALTLLCRFAFTSLGLERIILKTHFDNLRSQAVAKRAGFKSMEVALDKKDNVDLWFERIKKHL
jgi:ribosomal-protein-alanine N-acetyltransferase